MTPDFRWTVYFTVLMPVLMAAPSVAFGNAQWGHALALVITMALFAVGVLACAVHVADLTGKVMDYGKERLAAIRKDAPHP